MLEIVKMQSLFGHPSTYVCMCLHDKLAMLLVRKVHWTVEENYVWFLFFVSVWTEMQTYLLFYHILHCMIILHIIKIHSLPFG